jgi:hypothetical protein
VRPKPWRSFFDAHENVIGISSGTPEGYAAGLFTSLTPGDFQSTILPAPAFALFAT